MGHSVKASFWCVTLSINTRYLYYYYYYFKNKQLLSASDVTLKQSFQMIQEGYQVIIILPIKREALTE